jgi:hypothetical protein
MATRPLAARARGGERPYLVDVNARSGATVARFDGKLIPIGSTTSMAP